MFCSTCGSPVVVGAAHCGNCGSATSQLQTTNNQAFGSPAGSNYGAPNPYQNQQAGTYPPPQSYYAPAVPASGKAIASLVLSLLGISLIGLILGYSARTEIRNSQGRLSGDGMALAGIILGWIGTAGWLLFWVVIFVAASMAGSYYY